MKILFVCLGNICRSPLAEGILKDKLMKNNLPVEVDSAGFEDFHVGDGADRRSIEIARSNNIDITDHVARCFSVEDFDFFDRIYVMDSVNYSDVISMARNKEDLKKVDFVMNTVEPGRNRSVPDPYYGGHDGFRKIFQMLDLACDAIIEDISQKKK